MTARRLLLLLVAAVLVSLGFAANETESVVGAVPPPAQETGHPAASAPAERQSDTETVALEQSVVNAVPPVREVGRLAADPGLLKVHSVAEMADAPSTEPELVRLGGQNEDVLRVSRVAALPVADDRGPPVRQVF